MKRMKKLLSMLVVLGGALGLVACAGGDEVITNPSTEPTAPVEPSVKPTAPVEPSVKPTESEKPEVEYTSIAKAKEIAIAQGENPTSEEYLIKATVKSILKPEFGSMIITDGTDELEVYNTKGSDRKTYFDKLTDKPGSGDEIVISCTLHAFNGKPEVKQAYLMEVNHVKPDVNPSDYKAVTILEARNAKADAKLKVTGVVAQITYANGMKPNGFILIDETASIYVYSTLATEVKEGNTITIAATKAYYVSSKEANDAAKLGYKGANQLTDAKMLENDKKVSDFSMSAVESLTVKEVLAKPIDGDNTGKVYKSTAIVKKAPGAGFTNYYIDDLDGKTGSYTYSQANGNDFAWLDEFDGKVCEVIYTPLNAKCTSSGHMYRFVPISVKVIDNYEFDKTKACDFVNEYYIQDQFQALYRHNPELEVLTTIDNKVINLNATISYTSNKTDVVNFETTATGVVMNTLNPGTAEITVKVTAMGNTKDFTITIMVKEPINYETISVKAAVDIADKTEVVVKGIVGPSLINKDGFYLMDETGVIAVQTTKDMVKELTLGDEVIVKGTKDHKLKEESAGSLVGQANIFEASILDNSYGNHKLPQNIIITDKTMADLVAYAADPLTDYTTTIYRVEAKVTVKKSQYATNVIFEDPANSENTLMVYNANAGQVEWLKKYDGKTVTLDVALCNWNDKKIYKCCPLAITSDGSTEYNIFNLKK